MRSQHLVLNWAALSVRIGYEATFAQEKDPVRGRIEDLHGEPSSFFTQMVFERVNFESNLLLLGNNRGRNLRMENSVLIALATTNENRGNQNQCKSQLHWSYQRILGTPE